MKILKKILIGLVIIIAIPFITALFINGKYDVVRETTINQPKDMVFEYVKYLKNQDNFSVWSQMDPNMKKGFEGNDGTVGSYATWDSEVDDVGKGEQEITKIIEGERIDFELRFLKPFEATDVAYFITDSIDENKTKVQWGFNGEMDYPMNLMLLFMDMEEMLAPSLEEGLTNLKDLLEKMPTKLPLDISEIIVEEKPILFIEESSPLNSDTIKNKIGNAFGEIMALMSVAHIEMVSPPLAITNEFSMSKMLWVFDCALIGELPEGTELSGRIKSGTTYAGKVVKAVHVGPYEQSIITYNAIEKYISNNKLEKNGRVWEEYIDDPTIVDPEELRTNIYFPVK
jgi:effector-binding domain-containing protein